MKKNLRPIPHFKTETEERNFWQTHDSTQYVDYSQAKRVRFPNLKLSSHPITIRLPDVLIERIKLKAHRLDMPYQSLMRRLIFDGLAKI